MQHATGRAPKTAVLIGLGPTRSDFLRDFAGHAPALDLESPEVEVWTLNTGIRLFKHDLLWVMDDLEWYASRWPAYGKLLKEHDRPIITNTLYPDFPTAVKYPLAAVIEKCAVGSRFSIDAPVADYFRNSIPYILAYSYLIGLERLIMYGCDYDYPGARLEMGRSNVEYWIGFLNAKGIQVDVCPSSPLMDMSARGKVDALHPWFYGYLRQPIISVNLEPKPAETPPPKDWPNIQKCAAPGDAGQAIRPARLKRKARKKTP